VIFIVLSFVVTPGMIKRCTVDMYTTDSTSSADTSSNDVVSELSMLQDLESVVDV